MSLGYAEKLSYREDLGGQLEAKELFDKPSDLRGKVHQLKDLVRAVWAFPVLYSLAAAGLTMSSCAGPVERQHRCFHWSRNQHVLWHTRLQAS